MKTNNKKGLNRASRRRALRKAGLKNVEAIIMFAAIVPQVIHNITAVLDLPSGNADRGVKASKIVVDCTGNAYVSFTVTVINAITQHIADYNNSNTSTREECWRVVLNDLKTLMRAFQAFADANPTKAIAAIESGGFSVKKVNIRKKQEFAATNGLIEGTIDLIARGGGTHTCHDWMYSPDSKTWERMVPTVAAEAHKVGLVSQEEAFFKHQLITKDGPQGFGDVVRVVVK